MKNYLVLMLYICFSFANVFATESPFISQTESFVVSATTGFVVSSNSNQLVHQIQKVANTRQVSNIPKVTSIPTSVKIAHKDSVKAGIKGAKFGGTFTLLEQLVSGENLDLQQVGNSIISEGISEYTRVFAQKILQSSVTNMQIKLAVKNQDKLASKLISKKVMTKTLLSRVGNRFATGFIFSYGAYFFGQGDLKTANRSAVSSVASYGTWALGGAALGGGTAVAFTTSVAGMIGATAGTGTAISTLSGAAATNATLAWLGGGTLASGGGGIAAGTTVLAGISATGIGLVAVGIGVGITYLYTISDKKTEQMRVAHLLYAVQKDLN